MNADERRYTQMMKRDKKVKKVESGGWERLRDED
jgi:hypothetical protein